MTMPTRETPSGVTADQAALLASQQAYATQQEILRQQLAAAVASIWAVSTLTPNFDTASALKFVAQILPIAQGAQRAMAVLTVASLNQQSLPERPITVSPDAVSGANLRGIDPNDYYQRPFREIKYRLSQGKPLGEAIGAGQRRALSIAATDLQLAHTRTARSYLRQLDGVPAEQSYASTYSDRSFADEQAQRVADRRAQRRARDTTTPRRTPIPTQRGTLQGFRRVLSSNPNHCALCVLASTQRYHREDLMPIHPGCGCTVAPLFSEEILPPGRAGQVIDPSLAQEIHNIIRRDLGEKYSDASGSAEALYRDIVVTNEHGELGPVLGVRGQHFQTDPSKPGHLGHIRVNPETPPAPTTNLDEL